jgi:hypothetical protein
MASLEIKGPLDTRALEPAAAGATSSGAPEGNVVGGTSGKTTHDTSRKDVTVTYPAYWPEVLQVPSGC